MLAIFLDIETTGLDPTTHHAIDLAFKVVDVHAKGDGLRGSYQQVLKLPQGEWEKRDPSSMLINGYTWQELAAGKDIKTVGKEVIELLQSLKIQRGNSIFLCQNPAFDKGFFAQIVDVYTQEKLNWPYHWLDLASMFWAVTCLKTGVPPLDEMQLSKNEIAKAHQLPIEVNPHRAMNGVDHLIACYHSVLEH